MAHAREILSPVEQRHSSGEIANNYACQRLIRTWVDNPDLPSSQAIPILHKRLMEGVHDYHTKGIVPLEPGAYRTIKLKAKGKPNNFFAPSGDVEPLMREFTHDLDVTLKREPISPNTRLEETIYDASWAYYTFVRLHPFLDGNGRVGRMILKRVMSARGYKDIIFQASGADGKERDAHIAALECVDKSGNLAFLELYLLDQLRLRYTEGNSQEIQNKIRQLMNLKLKEIHYQSGKRDLTEIWSGFSGVYIDGVKQEDMSRFFAGQ